MNNHTFKVVTPTADDAKEICNVMIQSITKLCAADYNNDPAIMKEWISNKTSENVALWINNNDNKSCAVLDVNTSNILGFALMNNKGEILLNYVLPSCIGKGVGKALLSKLEKVATDFGIPELSVVSTITAKSFYEKNGFIENGEPEYVGNILGDFPLVKYIT